MRLFLLIAAVVLFAQTQAQQGFTFTRFTTDDNTGLSSNVVYSLYQDEKGYIWTGTANGLQRFDGSKFIQFGLAKEGSDAFPYSAITQIIPLEGKLVLTFAGIREFGIFNPADFSYRKIKVKPSKPLAPRTDFLLWKDVTGELYLNVFKYGVLHYNKAQNAFIDDRPFPFPAGYYPALGGVYDDTVKHQIWFAGEGGLCVYDRQSRQVWYRDYNPKGLAILKNETVQDRTSQIYIDRARRFWVFGWPHSTAGQVKWCLDSTGAAYVHDTTGLLTGPKAYTEYNNFFETARSGLWIYGVNTLFNWDAKNNRFHYTQSVSDAGNNGIEYTNVYQMMEDRDGNIWVATDRGLYFTSYGSGTYSVLNVLFNRNKSDIGIEDIVELPGGEFWFATWGQGVIAADSMMQPQKISLGKTPPLSWPVPYRNAINLTWNLYYRRRTGDVWVGCQGGVMTVYNTQQKTTRYLWPPEANNATIRFINEDKAGNLWMGTQGGRLLKYDGVRFTVVQDIGNIIYKIFVDEEGLLWLATQDKGLYCVNPQSGAVVRHWTADGSSSGLYSNSGRDIEQLKNGTIVYGAGALNFIDKKKGTVRQLRYEDGLPGNSVYRLRLDGDGFLWIITANGLSRYNPYNHRITTYGKRDGITLSALTIATDLYSSKDYVLFAGNNALMMFKPAVFATQHPPPAAVITDFKIFNEFVPVDSLLQLPRIKLAPDQNSISVYFSSLSYQHRDRLTYYFKLEGVDKDWQAAVGVYFQNYSFLPPGDYTFKVYAENAEGLRSAKTTELHIRIVAPFWRTKWFGSTVLFLVLLVTYFIHKERVNRLLAVEKIRNRVARDLHDDMGSTLSTINILSAMAKSKMHTDTVKTAGYLSKISDNSQRMMEAMDDIVWSIKPSNDSMQRITARMREFATSVLEAKDILLHFAVADEVANVKLNMEARRDFFLIFKEALNNAAKYSKATDVWVAVTLEGRQLSFLIKDNGSGFDTAKADSGNGLGNMQKRADAVHGRLKLTSKMGEGTVVKLTIPAP